MPVYLWAAEIQRPLRPGEEALLMALLPSYRRERLLRIKEPEKRVEPLCAYGLLYLALRQMYGWRRLPAIEYSARGKPYFPAARKVHFNLSHTPGAVLVGLSDAPVGVDIERIRPVNRRTMERICEAGTPEDFFESWVRREARSKRSGVGVSTMLRIEPPLDQGEYYYALHPFPGYAAGVSASSPDLPEPVKKFTLRESV